MRALIVDDDERVLLCRFVHPYVEVWSTPGGGVEPGESRLEALRRELAEEVGLALTGDPPHLWHQVVVASGHATGYDGVLNDVYLVRTAAFRPGGTHTVEQLLAENLHELRWWTRAELTGYPGPAVFAPRALPELVDDVLRNGPPATPLPVGL